MAAESITITQPDDWHVHLRDGDMLKQVATYTARQFGRAIIMPNLTPPVTTAAMAAAYRDRILAATADYPDFEPLMTAYLTDSMDPQEIIDGHQAGVFTAAKLYPAGATTNSDAGVTDVRKIYPVLAAMQEIGMPLLVHGEVVDAQIDVFDREAVFIERIMQPLLREFTALKVVFEHITTKDAVDFVMVSGDNIAATITVHHLQINRNDMLVGGIKPHLYCLPIAKRELHRQALRKAATSGSNKFFLGTDTAPHAIGDKESACGCAGIFSAPHALENYAQVFEEENALDQFEAFASLNGPVFYGLPVNQNTVTLEKTTKKVPKVLGNGSLEISPYRAEEFISWCFLKNQSN
ncbi:dihydroorotase [Marinicella sp. S1101]|uniref:dihydroorotase n=1 Tax=Marinicella marina TaxID=2996016 RepID=UPI00226094A2|nr:dihydroorotase [Marinicella marina]MCX7555183.1 dihydroorotase [Marinicella marina]MDJ1140009.1 dihydroorotase [Marinicella marina]